MARVSSLVKLHAPIGGQEIELQQIDFDAGEAPSAPGPASPDAAGAGTRIKMLRTRIREGSRFTVFDVDPLTAEQWGEALLAWARAQPRG